MEEENQFVIIPKYIAEDDIPRDGGIWPEYAHTFIVCIDAVEDSFIKGRLYSYYYEKYDLFGSLDQLLFALDAVMDRAKTPQRQYISRSLEPPKGTRRRRKKKPLINDIFQQWLEQPIENNMSPFYDLSNGKRTAGKVGNFYLRVYTRRHGSMQGVLAWVEDVRHPIGFRSALELMTMVRDAVLSRSNIEEEYDNELDD